MLPSPTDPILRVEPKRLAWLLVVLGGIGLGMSAILLIEKIALIRNPDYVPTCSMNPILSCGNVMITSQAEAFGFPNPLIGLVGFSIVVTTGAAVLAGAAMRRWYWIGLQAGTTFGAIFVHWLIFQSLYRIGALCPYCVVVWVVTIPIFVSVTLHNIAAGHLPTPKFTRRGLGILADYHGTVLTAWYLGIAGLIAKRFWSYWSTLLP